MNSQRRALYQTKAIRRASSVGPAVAGRGPYSRGVPPELPATRTLGRPVSGVQSVSVLRIRAGSPGLLLHEALRPGENGAHGHGQPHRRQFCEQAVQGRAKVARGPVQTR